MASRSGMAFTTMMVVLVVLLVGSAAAARLPGDGTSGALRRRDDDASTTAAITPTPNDDDGGALQRFEAWCSEHGKAYDTAAERERRFAVWRDNERRVEARNRDSRGRGASLRFGLNALSDLPLDEVRARYLGAAMAPGLRSGSGSGSSNKHKPAPPSWRYADVVPPPAADWRGAEPPVLGPIKDQHVNGTPCGSCWAFSAVSIMEIASAMSTGEVVAGSEQQLIDCDRKYDHGCAGGGWLNAIQYTIRNRGLVREEEYPYTGQDGKCKKHLERARPHPLQVDSWEDVPFSNETAMAAAVSKTPIIVAICVGPALDDWHQYRGGVFDLPCCEKDKEVALDHGIVVVGYGTHPSEGDYWILKNSWGASWGDRGFMYIRRNHGRRGKCALASYPAMVFRGDPPAAAAAVPAATTTTSEESDDVAAA